MQYFVYIGRHNKTIELFSKLSTGVFYAAPNCHKATKVLDKIREKYDAALFIEQIELSKDIADIRSLRKRYPGLYMVLVIDSITKEEATEYLKAGVNNTIKYETNSQVLKDLSTFLTRRKEQKIEALQLKTQNLNAFCLPTWKRIFDIIFSGIALLFLSPLLIATAIAIRMESKGPIIYKSKRVGSNYLIFDFLKFRSMYTDADKHLKDFNALNQYQQEEQEEKKRLEKQRQREKAYREKRKAKKLAENGGEIVKTKVCPHCGKEFTPTSNRQIFCSKDCCYQARQDKTKADREAEKGSHYYRQRVCAVCGSTYWPTHSQQKLCSEECQKQNHNEKSLEFYHKKQKEKSKCKDLLQTKELVSSTNSSEIITIPA